MVIIPATFFGTVISLRCYSVWLLFLQRSSVGIYHCGDIRCAYHSVRLLFVRHSSVRIITVVLFGSVIIRYGYYSCAVLRYSDITAVLFGTVIIRVAILGTVILLWCYSVLLFIWRSSVR